MATQSVERFELSAGKPHSRGYTRFSSSDGVIVEVVPDLTQKLAIDGAVLEPQISGTVTALHGVSGLQLSHFRVVPAPDMVRYPSQLRKPEVTGATVGIEVIGRAELSIALTKGIRNGLLAHARTLSEEERVRAHRSTLIHYVPEGELRNRPKASLKWDYETPLVSIKEERGVQVDDALGDPSWFIYMMQDDSLDPNPPSVRDSYGYSDALWGIMMGYEQLPKDRKPVFVERLAQSLAGIPEGLTSLDPSLRRNEQQVVANLLRTTAKLPKSAQLSAALEGVYLVRPFKADQKYQGHEPHSTLLLRAMEVHQP